MKKYLTFPVLQLQTIAEAGGGLRPDIPDHFFKVISFIIVVALIIHFVKKL